MEDSSDIDSLEQLIKTEGKLIAFEFTLSADDGAVIDTNVGKEPMIFQTGLGEMLPALEEELLPMLVGEEKKLVLAPEQAYGPIREEAHRRFPLEAIPEKAHQVGHKVMSRAPDGEEVMVEVIDIIDNEVVLDFNHPLAGMTLHFDVKVISSEKLG